MLDALIADILADFTDDEAVALVPGEYVQRALQRVLPLIGVDLDIGYELVDQTVAPAMPDEHRELWALRARIHICRLLRGQAAGRVSFTSGDKRMDRSKEAGYWAALERDLAGEYRTLMRRLRPESDETVLTLDVTPLVFEQGSAVD